MQPIIGFLTAAGVGSRRRCFDLLVNGKVQVNGAVVEQSSKPVDPEADEVTVEGQAVAAPSQKVYLKLNKPVGVISTVSDERGRRTVVHLVPAAFRDFRLYPVGRLDASTSGLLIMTNDGDLAHLLTHPKFEVEKEYHVLLDRHLTEEQLVELEGGVRINGRPTAPARIVRLRKLLDAWYSVTIHEGKKRELRLMFLAAGRTVKQLRRVRIGGLKLGNLLPGRVMELTLQELALLRPVARHPLKEGGRTG